MVGLHNVTGKMLLQDVLLALEFVTGLFVLELVMSMFTAVLQKMLRSTLRVLELAVPMFTTVLQSMPSPLEMRACIAVVDGSEAKSCFQVALAVTSLCLAVCD